MASREDAHDFARKYGLCVTTTEELVALRRAAMVVFCGKTVLERIPATRYAYRDRCSGANHAVLVYGNRGDGMAPYVHVGCELSDFGLCDCAERIKKSMIDASRNGGMVIRLGVPTGGEEPEGCGREFPIGDDVADWE